MIHGCQLARRFQSDQRTGLGQADELEYIWLGTQGGQAAVVGERHLAMLEAAKVRWESRTTLPAINLPEIITRRAAANQPLAIRRESCDAVRVIGQGNHPGRMAHIPYIH